MSRWTLAGHVCVALWSFRWRVERVRYALMAWQENDHRFIDGQCLCGHRTCDDLGYRCPIWRSK
jgi:hypothetical protein